MSHKQISKYKYNRLKNSSGVVFMRQLRNSGVYLPCGNHSNTFVYRGYLYSGYWSSNFYFRVGKVYDADAIKVE